MKVASVGIPDYWSNLALNCSAPSSPQSKRRSRSRAEYLLENEEKSDVEFVVGPDGDTWRLPAHRLVLAEASPVFRAMLTGPLATRGPVRILDVEGRSFQQLLQVLYGLDPDIRSEQTCLQTLYCANKYLCPRLVSHCVSRLDSGLDASNVLRVLQMVLPFATPGLDPAAVAPFAPSAPPASDDEDADDGRRGNGGHLNYPDPNDDAGMGWWCAALVHNCLQFIDANIDRVLEDEYVEDLSHSEVMLVVSRSSLALRSELRLFAALVRWSDREVRRRGLRLCPESRRAVLGDALYCVRYLQMSSADFIEGPVKSALLLASETAYLLGELLGKPQPLPELLAPHTDILSKARPQADPSYIPLSARSAEPDGTLSERAGLWGDHRDRKKEAKALKKLAKKKRRESQSRCSSTCFAEAFFSVLACIFD